MAENYIVINGEKAELTEEQLEQLGIKIEKNYKEMFDRVAQDEKFFYMISSGRVEDTTDIKCEGDDNLFNSANYCTDRAVLQQRAYHEVLNRLLWRASVIAGELDNEWDGDNPHYAIYYDVALASWNVSAYEVSKMPGMCYFPTRASAEAALEKIIKPFMEDHPDFVW